MKSGVSSYELHKFPQAPEILWPDDGALFSPLYAIFKAGDSEVHQACADFLFGAELGGILAKGWFTHINPEVKHPTPEGAGFRWVGWDYIYERKITCRVAEIEAVYYDERRKVQPEGNYSVACGG